MRWLFCTILMFALSAQTSWASDDFGYLIGKWTPTTGPNTGAPFWFSRAFAGFDAIIPWWGQTTIIESEGKYSSHLKIVASKDGSNTECFYYVNKLDSRRMAWNLRFPSQGSSFCPESLVFEREGTTDFADAIKKARGYLLSKDYDTAIAELNAALKIDPSSSEAFELRGSTNSLRKSPDAALADFSEAIRLSSSTDKLKQSDLYNKRGNVYYVREDFDRAIANYSDAIRLNPGNAAALENRGDMYWRQGNLINAKRDYEEALVNKGQKVEPKLRAVKEQLATFDAKFCNSYSMDVFVAVAGGVDWNSTDTTINGWWKIAPNACVSVGRHVRSIPFYWIADGADGYSWRGDSASGETLCIATSAYRRKRTSNYKCSPNEKLTVFAREQIGADEQAHTVKICACKT